VKDFDDPPAEVRQAEDLRTWATKINAEHDAVGGAARKSLEHARAAGEMCFQAKQRCSQEMKPWSGWVQEFLSFSRGTAERYIKIYLRWGKLSTVDNLRLREALNILNEEDDEDSEDEAEESEDESRDGDETATQERSGRKRKRATKKHILCTRCARLVADGYKPVEDCPQCAEARRHKRAPGSESNQQETEDPSAQIPERLVPVLASAATFDTAGRAGVRAANATKAAEESAAYKALEAHERNVGKPNLTKRSYSSVHSAAAQHIGALKPEQICPDCNGIEPSPDADWCARCGGKGFLIADDLAE
jgi:hypothetical protein